MDEENEENVTTLEDIKTVLSCLSLGVTSNRLSFDTLRPYLKLI